MLVSTRGFELHQAGKGSYSHDLEGAVGCVEELELLDGTLGHRVEGGATPAPLHQADGLGCGTQSVEKVEVLDQRSLGWMRSVYGLRGHSWVLSFCEHRHFNCDTCRPRTHVHAHTEYQIIRVRRRC